MENIKNKIPDNLHNFFNELSNYLDTPLLFYGSVQRFDYLPGHSDIDVSIFTDNISSMKSKMSHFLQNDKNLFEKFILRLKNKVSIGYKLMYQSIENNIMIEFSIHDIKLKECVIRKYIEKSSLPFYISWMLILLKFIHYKLRLCNRKTFNYIKNHIFKKFTIINNEEDFFVFGNKDKKI